MTATTPASIAADDPVGVLAGLESGRLRAAWPDSAAPGGWRVEPGVKAAILARFADRSTVEWDIGGVFRFRDRVGVPVRTLLENGPDEDGAADAVSRPVRIVPGGTSIRAGVHLGRGVVILPPSYVNVGAWVGDDTMIDSHVLVGSCAQVGARVHLAAGVLVGGVLEPAGARPVIIEDDAFIGAGSALLEGVLIGRGAVVGAGVTLTGTSRVYDLVRERVLDGRPEDPLAIPPRAVVVPGARPAAGDFAERHGLSVATALIVKDRDVGTDARLTLEAVLR